MDALITWKDKKGTIKQCSKRCWNKAIQPRKCHCICGGMNHGVGLYAARRNTKAFAEIWAKEKGAIEWELSKALTWNRP